jgi:hypothetical protein
MTVDVVTWRRILTAAELIDVADIGSRDSEADLAAALITADAAIETLLGIGAVDLAGADVGERADFRTLLDAAYAKLGLSSAVKRDLRQVHLARIDVTHRGGIPSKETTLRAIRSARDLLQTTQKALGGVAGSAASLPGAVAAAIEAPEIGEQLLLADAALSAGDTGAAADATLRAFEYAQDRCSPPLPRRDRTRGSHIEFDFTDRGQRRQVEELQATVHRAEPWIMASAFGLRPRDVERLHSILGQLIIYDTYPDRSDEVMRGAEPDPESVGWALQTVARVVFRLHELRAFFVGQVPKRLAAPPRRR